MTPAGRLGEDGIIALAERLFGRPPGRVVKGVGDDAAVITPIEETGRPTAWLWTTDQLIEGVHFRLEWTEPLHIGRKAISVNVSDIAAMGGTARLALASLALPAGKDDSFVEALLDGLAEAAAEYGLSIIGGDTTGSPGPVMVSVTLWGEAPAERVVYRSGGREGDLFLLSRPIGGAGAALAGLEAGEDVAEQLLEALNDPTPEDELGPLAAETGLVSAMMDLSDGLLIDAERLAKASNLAAVIEPEKVPLMTGVHETASRLGLDPVYWPLGGGEDYALLIACAPGDVSQLQQLVEQRFRRRLTVVGRLEAGRGLHFEVGGQRRPAEARGFDHFAVPARHEEGR